MNTGEIWFVRVKNADDAVVSRVEIKYINGNVVGFGDAYYDLRLLDFVTRDYEEEERRAQEKFMEQMRAHDDDAFKKEMLGSFEIKEGDTTRIISSSVHESDLVASSTPTKLSWGERFKIWWITHLP